MKEKMILSVVPVLALSAVAGAQAAKQPYSIAAGINYPTSSDARNATKNYGYLVQLGYHMKPSANTEMPNVDPSIEIGFARNEDSGRRLDALSIMAMGRWDLGTPKGGQKVGGTPYAGFGVGAVQDSFHYDVNVNNGSGVTTVSHRSDTKWNFGARALLGYSFGTSAFVEAAYNLNGSIKGTRADALTLSVGVRF